MKYFLVRYYFRNNLLKEVVMGGERKPRSIDLVKHILFAYSKHGNNLTYFKPNRLDPSEWWTFGEDLEYEIEVRKVDYHELE